MSEKKFSKTMAIVYLVIAISLVIGIVVVSGNTSGNANMITVDGYMGPLTLEVSITDGLITSAKVATSTAGEFIEQSAEPIFSKAIASGNANGIDVVAGATATSKALISALQQAYIAANTDETSIIGYGEGYKGPLSVIITTEGEKLTSAELLTISDSDFSLPTAQAILEQAVEMGNVDNLDVISGATGTSTGIITALQDAMSK